jgi:hypothetical protein
MSAHLFAIKDELQIKQECLTIIHRNLLDIFLVQVRFRKSSQSALFYFLNAFAEFYGIKFAGISSFVMFFHQVIDCLGIEACRKLSKIIPGLEKLGISRHNRTSD